jgi:glucokinase
VGTVLGLDIGGSSLKLGAWDMPSGERLLWREGIAVPQSSDPQATINALEAQLRQMWNDVCTSPETAPRALGIGSCGLIADGVVLESPNTPWDRLPLSEPLAQTLGIPVSLINDADAFLLGVLDRGGAEGELVLGITLGTGIGTAVWLGDRLLAGGSGISPEAGHITIDMHGAPGITGIPGDWEHLAAKGALLRYYHEGGGPLLDSALEAAQRAGSGDAAALKAWRSYGLCLGIGLASLCNIFSPARILLGGGMAPAHGLFGDSLAAALDLHMLRAMPRPQLIYVKDQPDTVALGAARRGWQGLEGK